MKRSISLLLAIVLVLSLAMALPQTALAADALDRAAVVQRLYALEGRPAVIQSVVFADAAGKAYSNAATWACGAGIVQGDGDGCFHGDRAVTRAELVTMLYRYARFKGFDVSAGEDTNILSYYDAFDLPAWCIPAFQWACGAGIAEDVNGYLLPGSTVTEAELAAALARLDAAGTEAEAYSYAEYPLERSGVALHLDCVAMEGAQPEKHILLIHGVTYSSHEFDIDYEDYSLVRFLARAGYAVWRLDIAGFGRSGAVADGFMPDSDYAAEDINAAVEKIVQLTGREKIDLLGWSWGTVTVSRFAAKHSEHLNSVVLYAPILSGLGAYEVTEPFHHNDWAHAADDFQRASDGSFDLTVTDPVVIELFCSGCWHYDGEKSPNGGRRDICVPASETLIDLDALTVPTLVICGDSDPYLNYDLVGTALAHLPAGSALEVIEGASHVAYIEKPYYHEFQDRLIGFLKGTWNTLTAIQARGVLRVGATGDYRPMSFREPETGEYWGFDAELAEDLADALGVELEYVPTTWPTLMADTLAGKFDLAICGITVTEARKEQALMSDGYLENGKTVLCRAEDADKYTTLEAINRPEVTVMENPGGLNEKFARENLPDAALVIHDVNEEIPGLVAAGEADVMITEVLEAGWYVGQDSRLAAPMIYEPFTRGQLGVLMPKGSEALLDYVNAFLESEKASGRIDALAEEYIYQFVDAAVAAA